MRLVVTLCALGAATLFLVVPQRWALALPLLVLAYFSLVQQPVQARAELASHNARAAGIGGRLDWIDRAVRGDDVVGVLWAGRTDPHVVWENEFFNRSVGAVYDVGRPMPGNLAVDAGRRRRGRQSCGPSLRSGCCSATGRSTCAARAVRPTAKRASACGPWCDRFVR